MTRAGLSAVALLLATAATALAALYTSGTYSAGKAGIHTTGVTIMIRQGSFSVKKASVIERCVAGAKSFTDHYQWTSGTKAHLGGNITDSGKFSGKWTAPVELVKVSGSVSGREASITLTEKSTFQPNANSAVYKCNGSGKFKANLTWLSNRVPRIQEPRGLAQDALLPVSLQQQPGRRPPATDQ
jgi:hypothetical protein